MLCKAQTQPSLPKVGGERRHLGRAVHEVGDILARVAMVLMGVTVTPLPTLDRENENTILLQWQAVATE